MAIPTNATLVKDRLYAQLAQSLRRMNKALSNTADLCEQLQVDLQAMQTFAAVDAAKFMTVAAQLNPPEDDEMKDGDRSNDSTQ